MPIAVFRLLISLLTLKSSPRKALILVLALINSHMYEPDFSISLQKKLIFFSKSPDQAKMVDYLYVC
jgi:hypothetical protein